MKLKWYHALPIFLATGILAAILNSITADHTTKSEPLSVPEMHISLNGTTLSNILAEDKRIKYPGNEVVIVENAETTTFSDVEIKGRGNSTWGWPKSPFQIKFDHKVSLFNMGAAKKYILLANFLDKSNLRNDIAFKLEQMLNIDYTLKGQFVELYFDSDYQGLYYLTEKIEIDKNRLALKDENAILVELENLHSATESCDERTAEGTCLIVKDVRIEDSKDQSLNILLEDFNQLEQAAKSGDYAKVQTLADIDSFAKYYLLSELTVNPDAYSSSLYFYQDGPDDKIHVAPGWDYDLALGNHVWSWAQTEDFYEPETTRVLEKYAYGGHAYDETTKDYAKVSYTSPSKLFFYLYHEPEFKQTVTMFYNQYIKPFKTELIDYASTMSQELTNYATKDRTLWQQYDKKLLSLSGVEEVSSTPFSEELGQDLDTDSVALSPTGDNVIFSHLSPAEAYQAETDRLIDWLSRRLDHLDYEYNGMDAQNIHLASRTYNP